MIWHQENMQRKLHEIEAIQKNKEQKLHDWNLKINAKKRELLKDRGNREIEQAIWIEY